MDKIRNFSIIAHIDHGKSTLADRILELTGAVDPKKMQAQLLDSMDLKRERGITIKAQAVRVEYKAEDGENYHFQLIDTPGHVDFSYEVSRSLAACEGALLVVDAGAGGRGADRRQYLPGDRKRARADPGGSTRSTSPAPSRSGSPRRSPTCSAPIPSDALWISAKTGKGVPEVLEAIVARIPPPTGEVGRPLAPSSSIPSSTSTAA